MDAATRRAVLASALARVASGDKRALEAIYRDTSAKLLGVVLRIVPNRAEAEEVLQEVYLRVWRNAAAFDPARASPITWLAAIARNRAIDRARQGGGRTFVSDEAIAAMPDGAASASETVEASEASAGIERCLEELEPPQAGAVRMAFFEGLTYDALASKVGVPLGTMKSWIRRSLLKLRDCLGEAYV
ncbi:MAG: sigma-70 family RNA polymerase sigma factor [Caulobacter sp.]|nr:sigma-70 family RNA polymerase sigma factor [Caulobacter sp.]